MKRKDLIWIKGLFLGFAVLLFTACSDDDGGPAGKGEAEFKITDAPSDDPNIKGVFVTVADVKVDGHSIDGFTKQTIDLKAYQNGRTELLGTSELDARTYSNLTLVLDLETDANGNAPGCYVLDVENNKHKLKSTAEGTASITLNKAWTVSNNAKSTIIMDFDLRKSIQIEEGAESDYSFVSDNELNAAVRVVNEAKTGTVEGTYEEESNSNADKIIVYAYKRGTFNAETETTAQGEAGILFKNAVSSSELESSLSGKTFTLAFLEEGEYELVFAGYNENTTSGRLEFNTTLKSETQVDGSVGNFIQVESGITLNISTVIGVL